MNSVVQRAVQRAVLSVGQLVQWKAVCLADSLGHWMALLMVCHWVVKKADYLVDHWAIWKVYSTVVLTASQKAVL
jgi:hypothetical protein